MAGTEKASTEATAPVEDAPAEKTSDEEFADAFEEFAAEDDTEADAPAPGAEVDEKPAAAEPEKTDDPAPAEAAPEGAAETPDIWGDATPEQKAAFEAATHETASNRNRASAQNRKIAELMAAAQPAAAPAAAPAADVTEEAKPTEKWEKFDEEYPEVAGPVRELFAEIRAENAEIRAKNAALESRVTGITDVQVQDALDSEEAVLLQRHPDWDAVRQSDAFKAWYPDQPRYVQEGLARNGDFIVDGQEAASLIDLFKGGGAAPEPTPAPKTTETNGKVARRQRRMESAVTSESGQAGPGAGPPSDDFDAAFEHFAKQP